MPFIRSGPERDSLPVEPQCSFCGKDRTHVARIIRGPGVCICNECVDLCNRILEVEAASAT